MYNIVITYNLYVTIQVVMVKCYISYFRRFSKEKIYKLCVKTKFKLRNYQNKNIEFIILNNTRSN